MTGISFKECQLKAIQAALNGNHTFISLPTGFGKSIVYQILPFAKDYFEKCRTTDTGITLCKGDVTSVILVISPLLALMEDQCQALVEKGVAACFIGNTSNITEADIKHVPSTYSISVQSLSLEKVYGEACY